jgi:ABC-type transport system involved in multi-copper enzyme maturation permease subunit
MVRVVALVFGVSFLAVGALGFILNPTGGELLGIFAVNVLHNLVHLLFGVFGIAAALVGRSRIYLQGVGIIYLLLAVLGFIPGLFVGDEMLLGLVHINLADNFLHLGLGGAAAFFGFAPQYRGQVSPTA